MKLPFMLDKLKWRIDFLRDPARYFDGRGEFGRIRHAPLREALESESRRIPLWKRLQLVNPLSRSRPDTHFLLSTRIRATRDREPYFDVGDLRIFFRPDHAVTDGEQMLRGALIIMVEAFVRPISFFHRAVRIAPGDVVLDLGGNLGTSAILFAERAGSTGAVYSFEPVFGGILERNLRENGVDNVEVVPFALGNEQREVEFSVTNIGIDSRMTRNETTGGVRVPMTTLDAFVEDRRLTRVDFVKLDIEGAEELALRGAERTIRQHRPCLSIASYHDDPEGDPQHPKLVDLLGRWGYRTHEVEGRHIYAWFD